MAIKDRKVLVSLDNCLAHPRQGFNNTDSFVQSIIKNYFHFYISLNESYEFFEYKGDFLLANTISKTLLGSDLIYCLLGSDLQVDSKIVKLYEAFEMLTNEWNNSVSKDTISYCFRHCDFFREPLLHEINSNDEFENITEVFSN